MENLGVISSSQKLVLGCSANSPIHRDIIVSNKPLFVLFRTPGRRTGGPTKATSISALSRPHPPRFSNNSNVLEKLGRECFASISSSGGKQTSSVGVNPQLSVPPPPSHVGSPLFWVGVGVGLSALFSWVATKLKNYAMQQAFKSMMGQMDSQNNQFTNAAFSPGSPFPFPTPPMPGTAASPLPGPPFPFPTPTMPGSGTSPSAPTSQRVVTLDVPPTKVEEPPATNVKDDLNVEEEPKKYAFVDVSPEETLKASPFESFKESAGADSPKDSQFANQAFQNGAASKPKDNAFGGSSTTPQPNPVLSVEALEKMMEDPTVQKMVYPYLPEEMRNPTTFKWMLQNPEYRQQLQDMLNSMGGSTDWDNRMMDSLKNFDISSPEVKQQFDQIGLTPEEVISKIMANPDVAMAFQNPRVQAAIMDCSQNPLSIAKYQNDKEVMDVFNKISELFPGVTGSP